MLLVRPHIAKIFHIKEVKQNSLRITKNIGGKMMEETISKDLGVKKLSEIEENKIEWLVPGYIPRGSISVIT